MKIRATVRLRNHAMLAARERMGLSQPALAQKSGCGLWRIGQLEKLDFSTVGEDELLRIAVALEISPEEIVSGDAVGKKLPHTFSRVAAIPADRLLEVNREYAERMCLPSPVDALEMDDAKEMLRAVIAGLPRHQREVIKMRYGLGEDEKQYTLAEVGRVLGLSTERIRQIEARAIRNLGSGGSRCRLLSAIPDSQLSARLIEKAELLA